MGVSRPPGLASVAQDVGSPEERQTRGALCELGSSQASVAPGWTCAKNTGTRCQVLGKLLLSLVLASTPWGRWQPTLPSSPGRHRSVLCGKSAQRRSGPPQSGSGPGSSQGSLPWGLPAWRRPAPCSRSICSWVGLWQGWPDSAQTEGSLHPGPGSALSWEVAAVPQPPQILALTVTLSSYTLTGGCCQAAPSSLRHRCPGGHRCCWGTVATASCAVAAGGAR